MAIPKDPTPGIAHRWCATAAAGALAFACASALAQTPLPVQPQRSQYCNALAPAGWSFTGENAAGAGFGADMQRADGQAVASYFVVGVSGEMRASAYYGRWYATPQQGALATLTQLGTRPVRCDAPAAVGGVSGLALMRCSAPPYEGVALFQAFPMMGNGYVLVIRTAGALPAIWRREAEAISAVSRSIRCNIPLRPSTFDYTSGLTDGRRSRRADDGERSDYSRWSGMENVHDPSTGQNYWVEAGRDWRENGPRGPGYYARINGEDRLLAPGRSD